MYSMSMHDEGGSIARDRWESEQRRTLTRRGEEVRTHLMSSIEETVTAEHDGGGAGAA